MNTARDFIAFGAISTIGLLITAVVIWFRAKEWNRRWQSKLDGIPIRWLVPRTPELERELTLALEIMRARHFPLHRIAIEIVHPGKVRTPSVPTGHVGDQVVAASIRPERKHPWSRPWWVAVITGQPSENGRPGTWLLHEVLWHIAAMRTVGHPDAEHRSELFRELTESAQKRFNLTYRPDDT